MLRLMDHGMSRGMTRAVPLTPRFHGIHTNPLEQAKTDLAAQIVPLFTFMALELGAFTGDIQLGAIRREGTDTPTPGIFVRTSTHPSRKTLMEHLLKKGIIESTPARDSNNDPIALYRGLPVCFRVGPRDLYA